MSLTSAWAPLLVPAPIMAHYGEDSIYRLSIFPCVWVAWIKPPLLLFRDSILWAKSDGHTDIPHYHCHSFFLQHCPRSLHRQSTLIICFSMCTSLNMLIYICQVFLLLDRLHSLFKVIPQESRQSQHSINNAIAHPVRTGSNQAMNRKQSLHCNLCLTKR